MHSEINLNSHSRKEPTTGPHNVHRRPARVGHTLLNKVKSPSMKTVHTLVAIVDIFTNFDGPLPSLTSHFSIISHYTEEIHSTGPHRGMPALYIYIYIYIYHYTNKKKSVCVFFSVSWLVGVFVFKLLPDSAPLTVSTSSLAMHVFFAFFDSSILTSPLLRFTT